MSGSSRALDHFAEAWLHITRPELVGELEWQLAADFSSFTESDLLREAAWVVLCSGFRESVVRRHFEYISLCFCDWVSAREIARCGSICVEAASASIGNIVKLKGILSAATLIQSEGFDDFKAAVVDSPVNTLQRLPFIGPVTSFHLAKNLGLNVAKADRHLVRLAEEFGYESVDLLCADIASVTGVPLKAVDLALWRYSADMGRHRSAV